MSTSMNPAPANNWMIIPLVMMGVIPSSISVPLLDARMTLIQYSGSGEGEGRSRTHQCHVVSRNNDSHSPDESDDTIPYSGICEHTRKMRSVTAVHPTCARDVDELTTRQRGSRAGRSAHLGVERDLHGVPRQHTILLPRVRVRSTHLAVRCSYLGEDGQERLDQIEETKARLGGAEQMLSAVCV